KGTENPYQPVRQCAAGSIDADIHFVLCSGTTSDGGDPAIPGYRAPSPDDGPNATPQHFSASSPSPSPPLASLVHQGTSPLYSPVDDGVTTRYAAAPAIVTIEVTGTALLSENNVAKIKEHLDWVAMDTEPWNCKDLTHNAQTILAQRFTQRLADPYLKSFLRALITARYNAVYQRNATQR
ncbi:hypothetical protein EJ05DRAFT_506061, partial [Pseudovirgaria hyperparasitica]